jgi:hypothetical protein
VKSNITAGELRKFLLGIPGRTRLHITFSQVFKDKVILHTRIVHNSTAKSIVIKPYEEE